MPEVKAKLARVRAWLKESKLDGVVFNNRGNFAWLTGGGDNHVVSQEEVGFGALYVTSRQAVLFANDIEGVRITAEEPVSAFTHKTFPWATPIGDVVKKAVGSKKVVTDDTVMFDLPGLPDSFYPVRAELLDDEIKRYKQLGRDCSLITETVTRGIKVGDSGYAVEAALARHLLARGIQPYVLLVAFDDRLKKYRHPTPTANHLRHHAMIVVCGRRGGQIASLTRFIHFGPTPKDILERHEAVCRVEGAMWEATKPGVSYGDALVAGIAQYKAEGFADEWKLHHQGGPTGYAGRDFLATPGEKRLVVDNQAVAWNPSITGTKTEDTFVVQGDERLVLTECSKNWPTVTVTLPSGTKLTRPGILER